METTTSSDDARTTCALRLVVVVAGVALLFAEEEVDFTDIKPEERSDLEEVIVKLMINGKVNFVLLFVYIGECVFLDL